MELSNHEQFCHLNSKQGVKIAETARDINEALGGNDQRVVNSKMT